MADLTQIQKLKIWIDVADAETKYDDKLTLMLNRATDKIKLKRGTPSDEDMETRWNELQIQIALFLWNKQGAEGEKEHVENGVSRYYENADIPTSLLSDITPLVKVIS